MHGDPAALVAAWVPLVPNVAKGWSVSDDGRSFTFQLRAGMRWSDGSPFSTKDVEYWWQHEVLDDDLTPRKPDLLKLKGQLAQLTCDHAANSFTVTFHQPNALFLERCARAPSEDFVDSPAHYLRQYHPTLGDDQLIEEELQRRRIGTRKALYEAIKHRANPAHPRLWAWVYRTHQTTPPYRFVRNPYYWVVDQAGNQLPFTDQLFCQDTNRSMQATAAANGKVSFKDFKVKDYTLLMANREQGDYECYRWFRADRSDALIYVNINRAITEDDPTSKWKAQFLADVRFREALVLAIDRQAIIDAVYHGETTPAQVSPGPESVFAHPETFNRAVGFDPERANAILDELGLAWDGDERRFPDGSRMHFIIDYPMWFNPATAQFVIDDWAKVGIPSPPTTTRQVVLRLEGQPRTGLHLLHRQQ